MAAAICDAKSLRYVLGKCKDCNAFTKIDKLKIESLKCCIKKAAKRLQISHSKVSQFECVTYIHQGKEKKKIALVEKMVKLDELVHLLKLKLKAFHRYRITSRTHLKFMMN